ncbi:TonB family protein [Tahibacter amnicola]|uniref:Protein TonB n=1 Tax=Tahibacter amnicola TaxID=2976241 RepID=A0ABY6BHM3_9GAMM|nr:TonB family protein [Tahibacter amnicola]UXI69272.1 TonB family protein [Tahibacter amnicola]
MESWLGMVDPSIRVLGLVLLHFLWQGALVGIAFGALRPWLRPGHQRYAWGLGAFATLTALPLITAWYLVQSPPVESAATLVAAGTTVVSAAAAEPGFWSNWQELLPWLVALWGAGVVMLTGRALMHWHSLKRLIRQASPLAEWDGRLRELCRRFGVSSGIRLLHSAAVQTPTLVGWFKPVILLPAAVALGFPAQQIELILAHELGHLRRWDHVVNLFQVVVETVLFYHPVVHWISRDLRHQREVCCDELVLRISRASPRTYVETLADLEQLRLASPGELALTATGGVLLQRVQLIARVPPTTLDTRVMARLAPALLGTLAVLVIAAAQRVEWARTSLADVLTPWQLRSLLSNPADAPARAPIAVDNLRFERAAVVVPPLTAPAVELPVADAAATESAAAVEMPRLALDRPAITASAARLPAVGNLAMAARPAVAVTEPVVETAQPLPTQYIPPAYPETALMRGVEGQVELTYYVDAAGIARDIRVERADPPGVFERAAVSALSKWRFQTGTDATASSRFARTFVFSLGNSGGGARAPATDESRSGGQDCHIVTGTRICRRYEDGESTVTTVPLNG